jgi:hypothetical protein
MAHLWLEINSARGDLENAAGVVFHNRVVAIRATQATLNVGLVCIDARRGSLGKPQRDQQGRYDDQQECSLHGILRRFSPCGGLKFRLGFDPASDSGVEPYGAFGLWRENLEHPGETTQSYSARIWLSAPNSSHLKERLTPVGQERDSDEQPIERLLQQILCHFGWDLWLFHWRRQSDVQGICSKVVKNPLFLAKDNWPSRHF